MGIFLDNFSLGTYSDNFALGVTSVPGPAGTISPPILPRVEMGWIPADFPAAWHGSAVFLTTASLRDVVRIQTIGHLQATGGSRCTAMLLMYRGGGSESLGGGSMVDQGERQTVYEAKTQGPLASVAFGHDDGGGIRRVVYVRAFVVGEDQPQGVGLVYCREVRPTLRPVSLLVLMLIARVDHRLVDLSELGHRRRVAWRSAAGCGAEAEARRPWEDKRVGVMVVTSR